VCVCVCVETVVGGVWDEVRVMVHVYGDCMWTNTHTHTHTHTHTQTYMAILACTYRCVYVAHIIITGACRVSRLSVFVSMSVSVSLSVPVCMYVCVTGFSLD
jgi:hypothetical protein